MPASASSVEAPKLISTVLSSAIGLASVYHLIDAARKHGEQFVIISRRPRARLVAEIGGDDAAQRRTIRPGAMKILEKWRIDLVENLIARPVQFDDEFGDERAPIDGVEALAASISPAAASTFLPPACSITTGNAATSSAMVIGRSKNSSRVSFGCARRKPCHSTSASGDSRSPRQVLRADARSFGT